MSITVQSSFGGTHAYNGQENIEKFQLIPHGTFNENPAVSEILAKSVAGYIEATNDGTMITYVTKK